MTAMHSTEALIAARIHGFRKGVEYQQRLSVIDRKIADEADQVCEALKVIARLGPCVLAKELRKRIGLLGRPFCAAGKKSFDRRDMSLNQVVERVDPVGEGCDHLMSPAGGYADDAKTIARRLAAHRLCEDSK